jgi:L-threonylcarbamoyladenylate synthase
MSHQNQIQTEVVKVNAAQPEPAIIARAAGLLRAGEVVVFPTETVYGLGADVFQPTALERIFAAKERPYSDPLIAHIADEASLELLSSDIFEQACAQRQFQDQPSPGAEPAGRAGESR